MEQDARVRAARIDLADNEQVAKQLRLHIRLLQIQLSGIEAEIASLKDQIGADLREDERERLVSAQLLRDEAALAASMRESEATFW